MQTPEPALPSGSPPYPVTPPPASDELPPTRARAFAVALLAFLAEHASLPDPAIALAAGLAACLFAAALLPNRTRVATLAGAALGSVIGHPLWHAWLGPLCRG